MAQEPCSATYDWLPSGEGETIWSHVLSIGRLHPLNEKEVGHGHRLIVIIPGNPGHCQFYETFASHLIQQNPGAVSVWALSHVGHVRVPPELASRANYITGFQSHHLSSQVKHKLDFLRKYVPRKGLTGVTLVGHSIGSYIIMEILDQLAGHGIVLEKAFLLFPTLERMRETPNGQFMLKLRTYWINRLLDTVLPTIAMLLPRSVKLYLINCRCRRHRNSTGSVAQADQKVVEAAVDLAYKQVVSQAMEMAYDELEKVRGLNEAAFNKHGSKLFLVYAMKDDWSPLTYREQLIGKWPKVKNVVIDNHGIEHAFVIFDSEFVADLVHRNL